MRKSAAILTLCLIFCSALGCAQTTLLGTRTTTYADDGETRVAQIVKGVEFTSGVGDSSAGEGDATGGTISAVFGGLLQFVANAIPFGRSQQLQPIVVQVPTEPTEPDGGI